MMRGKLTGVLLVALTAALVACPSAGAAMVGIYRNALDSKSQRSQLAKLAGRNCARAGSAGALRIGLGEKTGSCSFRTPVLGRDLEISATERLLSGTPKPLQRKAYVGLELRAGAGAKYQLLAYPLQRKVQLVKVTSEGTKFLAIAKNQTTLGGLNEASKLRLSAINITTGPEKAAPNFAPTSARPWSAKRPTPAPASSPAAPRASSSAPAKAATASSAVSTTSSSGSPARSSGAAAAAKLA